MRGNALLAMGRREEGLPYIERAYGKNATNEITRDVLAGLYFENKGYNNVIQLYGKGGVNQQHRTKPSSTLPRASPRRENWIPPSMSLKLRFP